MTVARFPFFGCFRRAIDLKRWDHETFVGWLEDDFHHFGLTLVAGDGVVRDLRVAALRYPWGTCGQAGEPLRSLIGQSLVARASDVGRLVDMRRQCTHLFDLAGLLLAHAYHQRDHRSFRATVTRMPGDEGEGEPRLRATLFEDRDIVMWWDLDGHTIVAPELCAGRSVDRGFREWTEAMTIDEAEQAFVLRRAFFVGTGRMVVIRGGMTAADVGYPPVCHTYQPGVREHALRRHDSIRRFDTEPEALLSSVDTKP
jgi:hypothetical protein